MWAETSSPTQRSWQQRDAGRVGKLSNAHTPAPSYVACKFCLNVSRFVQTALDDDPRMWASCKTATRVGVSIFEKICTSMGRTSSSPFISGCRPAVPTIPRIERGIGEDSGMGRPYLGSHAPLLVVLPVHRTHVGILKCSKKLKTN